MSVLSRCPWLLMLLLGCAWVHAQPILEDTVAFDPKGVEIKWAITNEQSPSNLKIYRSIPRKFSPETVSNLLSLAGLSENDRNSDSITRDHAAFGFTSKQQNRHWIRFSPITGSVELSSPPLDPYGKEGDLVPSKSEVIQRGSNLFATLFNIGTNQWAFRDSRPMLSCTGGSGEWTEPKTKRRVKCVTHRGVFFNRAIDGCLVMDQDSGAEADFVEYGKLHQLKLEWPSVEPVRELPRASLDYCKQTLAQGGAYWSPYEIYSPKRIVIQRIDYCYLSQRKRGEQKIYSPLIRLSGTAYDSRTNAPVYFFCRMAEEK